MSHGLPFCFSSAVWLLVARTSSEDQMEVKSPGPAFYLPSWPMEIRRHCRSVTQKPGGSVDTNPGQCQKHLLGRWGQPGDRSQAQPQGGGRTSPGRTPTWPVGWESLQDARRLRGRWPSLTLTLSSLHRTESEAPPRPASPKVSRSPSEAATPAEDVTRRSKLAGGGRRGKKVGRERARVFRQLARSGIQVAKSPGLLPRTLGSHSSSVTLGR